jgi:hypothetical protein
MTLVVPVQLEAMVVNPQVQKRPWRLWGFNYLALQHYTSPEPDLESGQLSTQPPPTGVHLHWTLPAALRHGRQKPETGKIAYPPAPNRWLVVRRAGPARQATAWVVESDCPDDSAATLYLVDEPILKGWEASGDSERAQEAAAVRRKARGGPLVATIGKAFPLAAWDERASGATFLTAVAPGNPAFSLYTPHHSGVFAFHDPMAGVDAGAVSYAVIGWHAHAGDDPLADRGTSWEDRLTALGWSAPAAAPTATSLCHGLRIGVPWDPDPAAPAPASPVDSMAGKVHLGIGPTTIDAFTALAARQLSDAGQGDAATVDVLRAFQYGLIPELEQVNGAELLRLAVHQAAFGSAPGGLRWRLVAAKGDGDGAADLTDDEAKWLATVNADQQSLDAKRLELADLRTALYGVWWKWRRGVAESLIDPPDGFDDSAYQTAVETALPRLISVAAKAETDHAARVPAPAERQTGETAQSAFERGVAAFAAGAPVSKGKTLKAAAAPRLWRSNDPVVVLAGVQPAAVPDPAARLACRDATDVVTAVNAGGRTIDAAALGPALPALPAVSGIPAEAAALTTELFLLDPASAGAIAAAARVDENTVAGVIAAHAPAGFRGTLPAVDLARWIAQPWAPLFMEWEVEWLPVPRIGTDGRPTWGFDGVDYRFTGSYGPFDDADAPKRPVSGISLLTPEAQFTFGARLRQFVDTFVAKAPHPSVVLTELAHLFEAIGSIDQWRFASQTLTGFGDRLAQRDARAQTGPDATIAKAVAGQTGMVPYMPNGPSYAFEGVRQGHLAVRRLIVYDTFGQVLTVVGGSGGTTDPQNFAPVADASLLPDKPLVTRNAFRFVQLPPRVLQHARLNFELVDATDDTAGFGMSSTANPVAGWLLPNHLEGSIMLYAPGGRSLGRLRRTVDAIGKPTVGWDPPPHVKMTPADVNAAAPRLAGILLHGALQDPTVFATFLDVIDSTLWTIDPLGDRADQNLSVLVGRPLALVRARLDLELDGTPRTEQASWSVTWPPPAADFPAWPFPVRLGDQATRHDGLIGFYAGDDNAPFNSVHSPEKGQPQTYVRPIGPLGTTTAGNWLDLTFGGAPRFVTLLMDPRASVHAVTGILPVKTIDLPRSLLTPLSSLEVTFRVTPLLSRIEPEPRSVAVPTPAERAGTWSWVESDGSGGWTDLGLVPATPEARLKDLRNTLRDGWLQLVADVEN